MMRPGLPLVLCLLSGILHTQGWPTWGKCPSLQVQQDFVPRLLDASWYEQAGLRTKQLNGFSTKNTCVTLRLIYDQVTGVFNVTNTGVNTKSKKNLATYGSMVLDDPFYDEGRLTLSLKSGFFKKHKAPFWILGTDYDSYMVVYSCRSFLHFWKFESVWELSRKKIFTDMSETYEFFDNTAAVIRNLGLENLFSYITISKQDNCS